MTLFYFYFIFRFGALAGWAHTILFAGELAKFQADVTAANGTQQKQKNGKKKSGEAEEEDTESQKENTINLAKSEKLVRRRKERKRLKEQN
jgi:hypothetical protein